MISTWRGSKKRKTFSSWWGWLHVPGRRAEPCDNSMTQPSEVCVTVFTAWQTRRTTRMPPCVFPEYYWIGFHGTDRVGEVPGIHSTQELKNAGRRGQVDVSKSISTEMTDRRSYYVKSIFTELVMLYKTKARMRFSPQAAIFMTKEVLDQELPYLSPSCREVVARREASMTTGRDISAFSYRGFRVPGELTTTRAIPVHWSALGIATPIITRSTHMPCLH